MAEKYIPMANRLVAVPEKSVEKTEGGIIVTESKAYTSFKRAKVLSVGDSVSRCHVGDVIMYSIEGIPLVIDKVECIMLYEHDVDFVVK